MAEVPRSHWPRRARWRQWCWPRLRMPTFPGRWGFDVPSESSLLLQHSTRRCPAAGRASGQGAFGRWQGTRRVRRSTLAARADKGRLVAGRWWSRPEKHAALGPASFPRARSSWSRVDDGPLLLILKCPRRPDLQHSAGEAHGGFCAPIPPRLAHEVRESRPTSCRVPFDVPAPCLPDRSRLSSRWISRLRRHSIRG